jgi:serine/threonine-protein kinase
MCRRSGCDQLDADDHSLTRAGTVVGTPEYMAPEQASGKRKFDKRLDLYAVGVMLYETLTGKRAFSGPDPRSVLVAVLVNDVPSVRALRPELPVAVARVVQRAVERDPNARYATTGEFQHELLQARTVLRRERAAARKSNPGSSDSPWEAPTLHRVLKLRR